MESSKSTPNHCIKLNIGGILFEASPSTLHSLPPNSPLSAAAAAVDSAGGHPAFIDGDPDAFSPLLSLLRTRRLPSSALRRFSPAHLLRESRFYGLEPLLRAALSPPPLSLLDASPTPLSLPSPAPVSALSVSPSSLLLAHSGLVSSFDPVSLLRSSTLRTHLDHISSLAHLSPEIASVGSGSDPGLHFYSASSGGHVGSVHWTDPSDPRTHKARVTAVDSAGGNSVFSCFECQHGETAVLLVDGETMGVVSEIGRQPRNAVRKLTWTPALGVLVGSSVTRSAFGYSGYVQVWDPRSGEEVWETSEPGGSVRGSRLGDTMAGVDVDRDGLFLAKVCSKSGDLGLADLRKLGPDPWVYVEDPNPSVRGDGVFGEDIVVHCYEGNVFVGREGGLEAWSRVSGGEHEFGVYRRNYMDKAEDGERGLIRMIQGGGNRVFVCREDVEGVEVWDNSVLRGVL